ncbi:MAG: ribosome biogenesis GTP-binding protein YihA/YsxC [Candidatus Hydrogenedentota bacterium]
MKSVLNLSDCPPEGRPEFAFAGRSNVGKSSLLNTLLNRRGLAKTSKTPGKTRTLNFFDVNGELYLVDLPGYGYAKAPKALQANWGKAITTYLRERKSLRLVVHLLDARHEPTQRDHELLDMLDAFARPVVLVATKVDKLKQKDRATLENRLRKNLALDDSALIIPFSCMSGEGKRPLWEVLESMTAESPPP